MTNNTPAFHAYAVREREKGKKAVWTRLGAAWAHRDGEGLSLDLEALPVNFDGRIVLLPPKSGASDAQEGGAE